MRQCRVAWTIATLSLLAAIMVAISHLIYVERDRPNIVLEAAAACVEAAPPCQDCSAYTDEMEKWIKGYDKIEKQRDSCIIDLVRCQNETHIDDLCMEPHCE